MLYTVFTDKNVRNVLSDISALRITVFRDFPFLYDSTVEEDFKFIKQYENQGIIITARDGKKVIGGATGLPLKNADSVLQKAVAAVESDWQTYFYHGELMVDKAYRRKGIGRQLWKRFIQEIPKEYSKLCLCTVVRDKPHYLESFWREEGFKERHDIECTYSWKEIGSELEVSHTMRFWTKENEESKC